MYVHSIGTVYIYYFSVSSSLRPPNSESHSRSNGVKHLLCSDARRYMNSIIQLYIHSCLNIPQTHPASSHPTINPTSSPSTNTPSTSEPASGHPTAYPTPYPT
eukprot:406936-Amorphochlora_amoeboformis.AAC.1